MIVVVHFSDRNEMLEDRAIQQ